MITNMIGAILGCSVDMVGILHPLNVLEFVLLRWFCQKNGGRSLATINRQGHLP